MFSQVTKIWAGGEVIHFLSPCVQKLTVPIWVKFENGKKKHDSDEEKEKMQKKAPFGNDSDDTILESVSKLNKIVSNDDTNSDS